LAIDLGESGITQGTFICLVMPRLCFCIFSTSVAAH